MFIMFMPSNIQFTDNGKEINLPDGINFIRSKSSSRVSPTIGFEIGDVKYYSFCPDLTTENKEQLCHKDYEGISFTGENVTFLEIEKYLKNEKQYIGGIILKGGFRSKEKYINLKTDKKTVKKSVSFGRYFDFSVKFVLFFSLILIFIISIYLINKKRNA
ncbi:hypothetical protein EGK75_05590 [Neisseria weixii]|uniref:Uncharacterized protein n=2 Tax=Neisseria weixii TaxID=1853276 RepID=A0A3N4MW80_9NEIS|nr:hypothetical protein EGK74_05940 [Neisseria weixii]RPD89070.1 hypothetical protein EGK75_05590 [Neisseria weixii]